MSAGIPVCGAGMENLRYSDSGGRLGSAHIYSAARSSLLTLPLIPTSPSTTSNAPAAAMDAVLPTINALVSFFSALPPSSLGC